MAAERGLREIGYGEVPNGSVSNLSQREMPLLLPSVRYIFITERYSNNSRIEGCDTYKESLYETSHFLRRSQDIVARLQTMNPFHNHGTPLQCSLYGTKHPSLNILVRHRISSLSN